MVIVKDIATRNSIPAAQRVDGMSVRVMSVGEVFFLRGGITNNHWNGPDEWATTAAMELYVDPAGDDDTGTGAVGAPYLTITRAYEDVPKVIKHPVQIHIATGAYSAFPKLIENVCQDLGQLVFDGIDELTDDEGTLTVNTAVELGTPGFENPGFLVNVAGAAWVADEHAGKFLRLETGAQAGKIARIWSNTADTLTVLRGYDVDILAAETFIIGTPLAVITVTEPIKFAAKNPDDISGRHGTDPCRFGLGFLKFVSSKNISFEDTSAVCHAVQMDLSSGPTTLKIIRSAINSTLLFDLVNAFSNMDGATMMASPFALEDGKSLISNSYIICGSFMAEAFPKNYVRDGDSKGYWLGFGCLDLFSATLDVSVGCFFQSDAASNSIEVDCGSVLRIGDAYFAGGKNCIAVGTFGNVWIAGDIDCDSANYTDYGLSLYMNCHVSIWDGTIALEGVKGEIFLEVPDTIEAWPTLAKTSLTDGMGSFVTRR